MVKFNEEELKQLFVEIKANNKTAFEKFYTGYNKMVYGIAFSILKNKQDSEDVVQTVFTKIYEIDKNKLPTDKEASWIYTTTKNEAITLLRKKNNNINLEDIYEIADEDKEINEIINQDSFNKLLSKLNDKEKEIISLKIVANLSFEQIAKLLNEPTGTIKWRYYKSTNRLKLMLSNLAMFIITFIIGAKVLSNKQEQDSVAQESIKDENTLQENVEQNVLLEENKSQASDKYNDNLLENYDKVENNTCQNNNSVENKIEEEIIQEPASSETNYVGIGVIGISIVFLTITIISIVFFKKYQLKRNKKTSK